MEPQQNNINYEQALKQYKNHLESVKKYQQKNPDKMRKKANDYYTNLKLNNKEKYEALLLKKKEQYEARKKVLKQHNQ
jgi:hypothetical protein